MKKNELEIISQEVLELKNQLLDELTQTSIRKKLSTNEITQERLLWEVFNKSFSILITCENSLINKDSLAIHLTARYAYELLIVFSYLFFDESERSKRVNDFIKFNQFERNEQKWVNIGYSQMVDSVSSYNPRFENHKIIYRSLSNFAHPTMDSFLLSRRGNECDYLVILGLFLFSIGTIIEIIKICFEKNLFFTDEDKKKINVEILSERVGKLMKKIKTF